MATASPLNPENIAIQIDKADLVEKLHLFYYKFKVNSKSTAIRFVFYSLNKYSEMFLKNENFKRISSTFKYHV